jgi:hypothetical protein
VRRTNRRAGTNVCAGGSPNLGTRSCRDLCAGANFSARANICACD